MNVISVYFKKLFFIVLAIIIPVIVSSCSSGKSDTNEVSSGTPVTITHPRLMNMDDYLVLNGNTIFLSKEIIRSTFDGFIEKVNKTKQR